MSLGRPIWAFAVAAMVLENVVMWGLPAAMPGHSLLHDYISTAGATDAPSPAAFAAIGILAVVLHLFFVAGLWMQRDDRLHQVAAGLFAAFFVLLGLGLFFQCDPGCALETTEAWTHFWFGLAAFLALGLAALITAWISWKSGDHVVFGAAIALAVLDVLLLLSDQTQVLRGLTERLTLTAMMAWSVLWGMRWYYPSRRPIPAHG